MVRPSQLIEWRLVHHRQTYGMDANRLAEDWNAEVTSKISFDDGRPVLETQEVQTQVSKVIDSFNREF